MSVMRRSYRRVRIASITSLMLPNVSQCTPSPAYISFIMDSTISLSSNAITEYDFSTSGFIASWLLSSLSTSATYTGISTVKRLPLPFSLSIRIMPPSISTICFTIDSPSPNPSCVTAFESRSNAPNTRCCSSALIPLPVSSTIRVSVFPS